MRRRDPVRTVNDNSLIVEPALSRRPQRRVAGDVGQEGEAVAVGRRVCRTPDVVKVAHHGSPTSSTATFVRRGAPCPRGDLVRPRQPVSGFPSPAVLARWRRRQGATIARTDRDGAIVVTIDERGAVAVVS